jgi:hypothetical protein
VLVTADPVRRIANRRAIVARLRAEADKAERTAADLRARADRMEESIDGLEAQG